MSYSISLPVLFSTVKCPNQYLHLSSLVPSNVLLRIFTCPLQYRQMSYSVSSPVLFSTVKCPTQYLHLSSSVPSNVLLNIFTCPLQYRQMSYSISSPVLFSTVKCPPQKFQISFSIFSIVILNIFKPTPNEMLWQDPSKAHTSYNTRLYLQLNIELVLGCKALCLGECNLTFPRTLTPSHWGPNSSRLWIFRNYRPPNSVT